LREKRFYGALEEMLSTAIDYAKNGKDGGWLAYEMLKDGGVIPPRTMRAVMAESRLQCRKQRIPL
jgi:hypothetical protein